MRNLISLRPLLLTLLLCSPLGAHAKALRFFVLGDLPYAQSEERQLRRLLDAAVAQGSPFLVHLGDIKGGCAPCTDASLEVIADIFRSQPVPVVYTPGDNEWTDCHRWCAGGLDPLQRLERLRQVFFADAGVLRLDGLEGLRGLAGSLGRRYPEILSFTRDGVVMVALHVVGSDNGFRQRDAAAQAEMDARDHANAALLRRTAELAAGQGARAMVVFFHADPLFERSQPSKGFAATLRSLVDLMAVYPGRVLLIHGDSHHFRYDRPLRDPATGARIDRFERAEVPGSPSVGGLWISVDPEAAQPFTVEEVYPAAREGFDDP
ncbi:hypothetical protein [Thiocystis violacea]|uniref:hypothetical protein n=1 Tax=Thiocystis violacea TaxID=13725 RepID=UPI0031F8FD04